jgi:hypothetical protein
MRVAKRENLLCLILFIICILVRIPYCTNTIHISDAADYLRAARYGFLSNYLDSASIGLWGVVGQYRTDGNFRQRPWDSLSRKGDLAAFRHFHVPLAFYPHALAESVFQSNSSHRWIDAVTGSLLIMLIFQFLRRFGTPCFIAFGGCLVISFLPSFIKTSTGFSPHTTYLLAAMVCLFYLGEFFKTGFSHDLLAASVCAAVAAATLEFAPLLILTALIMMAISRESRRRICDAARNRIILPAAGCYVGSLILLWPGGIFKGSYLLSYATFAFQAAFRRDSYFGKASALDILIRIGSGNFNIGLICIVIVIATLVYCIWKRSNAVLLLFAIYVCLAFAQGLGNRFMNYSYVAQFLVPAWIFVGLGVSEIVSTSSNRSFRWIISAIGAAVALGVLIPSIGLFGRLNQSSERAAMRVEKAIESIRRQFPPGTIFLASNYLEAFSLYCSEYKFEPSASADLLVPRPWVKRSKMYLLIDSEQMRPKTLENIKKTRILRPLGDEPLGFMVSCAADVE